MIVNLISQSKNLILLIRGFVGVFLKQYLFETAPLRLINEHQRHMVLMFQLNKNL